MDERKRKLLKAIVKDYVDTAEPVGSRTIAKKYDLGVSSATIRNEMSDLEEEGYIEQPHVSAGRIPSQKGYRYFVDYLMEKEKITPQEISAIHNLFSHKLIEMDEILKESCRLLSHLTNYTALVALPHMQGDALNYLQLLPVGVSQVLVVMVTKNGLVNNRVFDFQTSVGFDVLSEWEQHLRCKFLDMDMITVNNRLLEEMTKLFAGEYESAASVIDQNVRGRGAGGDNKVFLVGSSNMLKQPEFQDIDKVKYILELLEQDEHIKNLMLPVTERTVKEDGVNVSIGLELPYEEMKECSLVTATYSVDGKIIGTVGVLGPTRMAYSKTVSMVDYVAKQLSDIFKIRNQR